jgi:CRP-like cAMP-binding protein
MELVKRFEGHDVAPGTVLIQEGDAGKGLFVVLLGEVEVARTDAAGRNRVLARLGAGELFGEMSLLGDRPTTATVRATTPTTILFLGRDYFRRLVGALPQLRQYFEELSKQRHRAQV